ncbi:MAG: hypothetical protein M1827_006691 [Pycnora praestabilis]|nr:MAG: hypothetical protein M1827_006691 [Pycnora praestabilis]
MQTPDPRRPRGGAPTTPMFLFLLTSTILLLAPFTAEAIHHMKRKQPLQRQNNDMKPLIITNNCSDTIWPAIGTQMGTPPSTAGFELTSGNSTSLTVGSDWQGRVWGRTNCTFNEDGTGPANHGGNNGGGAACDTGDCNGVLSCMVTGDTPLSLAEFTLGAYGGKTFYDISLVDGYNLPLAILSLHAISGIASIEDIPPNLTNPVCIGTAGLLAAEGFNPYTGSSQTFLGTNSSFPLSFEQTESSSDVQGWCPWDLQLNTLTGPDNGVYTYPDNDLQNTIPSFNPCYSACAKYNKPKDCCTGSYDSPSACQPSSYSQSAKKVCPDAYSFAYDDQDSTFTIPEGGGFEVVFCPPGRSTALLSTQTNLENQLAENGQVSES